MKKVLVIGILLLAASAFAVTPFPPWLSKLTGAVTYSSSGVSSLGASSISAAALAPDSVGSSEIATNAVGSAEIATSAVGSAEVLDGALLEEDIAPGAITTDLMPIDSADGQILQRLSRVTYDFAEHGGAIGTIPLGVNIPGGGLVERVVIYVEDQLVDAGAGTIALFCEDADNLLTAVDFTGNVAGTFVNGNADGDVANMVDGIAAGCQISIVIAGAAVTAGKIHIFVPHYRF